MNISDEIFDLSHIIGREIKSYFGDEVLLKYEKHISKKPFYFTIVLDIIVPAYKKEIDYGLTLSTNAQKTSERNNACAPDKNLFLSADICLGDGTILLSTEEILYNFIDENSAKGAFNQLQSFYSEAVPFIKKEMMNRYNIGRRRDDSDVSN